MLGGAPKRWLQWLFWLTWHGVWESAAVSGSVTQTRSLTVFPSLPLVSNFLSVQSELSRKQKTHFSRKWPLRST